jgi:hypothetical protein
MRYGTSGTSVLRESQCERGGCCGARLDAHTAAHASFMTENWMAGVIDAKCSVAHGTCIHTHAARRPLKGEASLWKKLQSTQPVSRPSVLGMRQRRRWTHGYARHRCARYAWLCPQVEKRSARSQAPFPRHNSECMRRTCLDARAASGARRQEPELGQCTRRPDISPCDHTLFRLRHQALEPVAERGAQQTAT